MKKHILIIAVICFTACKTRQVSIDKANISDKSVKTELFKSQIQHTDTTQMVTRLSDKKLTKDSTEIVITPDTGTIRIVNGNYIGKARNIVIKNISLSLTTANSLIQQKKGETSLATLNDSTVQKNDIQIQAQNKQIFANGIGAWWPLLIALLLLICLILARIKHYF